MRTTFFTFAHRMTKILCLVLLAGWACGSGFGDSTDSAVRGIPVVTFNDVAYRKLIGTLSKELASPQSLSAVPNVKEPVEAVAAYYYCLRDAYFRNPAQVSGKDVVTAADAVDRLWRQFPQDVELLTLRFRYATVENTHHFSSLICVSQPIVEDIEQGRKSGPWCDELVNTYYVAFLAMYRNYGLRKAATSSRPVTVPRVEFLYDLGSDSPTDDDVAMWRALALGYGIKPRINEAIWNDDVKRLSSSLDAKEMSFTEAQSRLRKVIADSLALQVIEMQDGRRTIGIPGT